MTSELGVDMGRNLEWQLAWLRLGSRLLPLSACSSGFTTQSMLSAGCWLQLQGLGRALFWWVFGYLYLKSGFGGQFRVGGGA